MTDLANIAAATGAGWRETATDRGANYPGGRYHCHLTKIVVGGSHQSGFELRADGFDDTSAANARANALAAANDQRKHRYGAGATANKDTLGTNLTADSK